MNYLEQIVLFYRWKEVNPLPASAIVIWHELMAVCNKAGWPKEFTVPNMVLQSNSGLSRKEFERGRQILIENDLISYKKSNRVNKAGKYKILPRLSKKDNEKDNRRGNEKDNEKDNFKELKDLNKNKDSTSSKSELYESFYAAHKRVFGFDCNPHQANTLGVYIDQDGVEEAVVVRAIERSGLASKGYKFGLITKILDDYFKSGVKTIDQAKSLDAQFDTPRTNRGRQADKAADFAKMAKELEEDE